MSTATAATYSGPVAAELAGITYRKLDYWCRQGVLGGEHRAPVGSGSRRELTAQDVLALRAVGRVSAALAELIGATSKVGSVVLYRGIADQVRAGAPVVRFHLAEHVALTVDIADLVLDPTPISPAGEGTDRPGAQRRAPGHRSVPPGHQTRSLTPGGIPA